MGLGGYKIGLNPEKITVEYMEDVTEVRPLIPRRYTLTHTDATGDLYLQIGVDFVYDRITPNRDEVLGEWLITDGFRFYVYVHMDKQSVWECIDNSKGSYREEIFRRELPLALQAIRFGDRQFFNQHPEMNLYPIIVYFLYNNPELNKAEHWGIFADYAVMPLSEYNINEFSITKKNTITQTGIWNTSDFRMDFDVLIDSVIGDINGDGIPEIIGVYGDKEAGSELIHNIEIKVESIVESENPNWFGWGSITELNGYNPTLFLGDFTNDQVSDILFSSDTSFNAMNSLDRGSYGASVITYREGNMETVFVSNMYNSLHPYMAEFEDYYKISIRNVRMNQLLFLDISYKGMEYLSEYYDQEGKLIKPVRSKVLGADPILPIARNLKEKTFDLLAIHSITGSSVEDILGYVTNILQWNGEEFVIVDMMVSAPGTYLIPPIS